MFILTPGASLGYEPTTKFVDYIPATIKSKIQLVVCLDQLIDSSNIESDGPPSLYVYDSKKSQNSSVRDALVYSLREEAGRNENAVAGIVEHGIIPEDETMSFVPYEHLAYAQKGIPAITLTVKSPESTTTSYFNKFSILDTELCLCKLSKLMFMLNEAIAQTIVSPDLQVEGQFFGTSGIAKSDKMYLKQVMRFLSSNSRAPWLIERGSDFSKELFRIFDENLAKAAQQIGVKIHDKAFVRESKFAPEMRIHEKGAPIAEMATFFAVFGYLYGLYLFVRFLLGPTIEESQTKVKTN